jgi:hypothetical protein
LTDRGRDTLAACEAAVDDLEHGMLAELSPDQVTLLRTTLIVAVRALNAGFQPSISANLIH